MAAYLDKLAATNTTMCALVVRLGAKHAGRLPSPAPPVLVPSAEDSSAAAATGQAKRRGGKGAPRHEANVLVRHWLEQNAKDDPAAVTTAATDATAPANGDATATAAGAAQAHAPTGYPVVDALLTAARKAAAEEDEEKADATQAPTAAEPAPQSQQQRQREEETAATTAANAPEGEGGNGPARRRAAPKKGQSKGKRG
jgi:hypothetical protein